MKNVIRHLLVRAVWKGIDWTNNVSAAKSLLPEGIVEEVDLPYVEAGNAMQMLDIYYPKGETDRLPVIIFTHGGGFIAGDKRQIKPFCMLLAKEGYVVFNINYRLAPKYRIEDQVKDVFNAMSWVNENCSLYRGDRNKIILAGDSAGAYLTAFASCISARKELADNLGIRTVFSEKEIKGVLLFSGLYDLETGSKTGFPSIKSDIKMLLGTDRIARRRDLDRFSVIKNITDKFPKAFISSGEADWLYPESARLADTLSRLGVCHKDMLFDKSEKKAMHDYQYHLELEPSKICLKGAIEFLNEVTE
jgi:acetyl esterase/lipase